HLAAPLVHLIATGRAPGHVRLAVPQGHANRQRRARALARREGAWQALLEPEHLPTRSERPAQFRNDRRGLQPAAGWGRREHVAGLVDDIDVYGVADHLAGGRDPLLVGAMPGVQARKSGLAGTGPDVSRAFDDHAARVSLDLARSLLHG